MHDLHNTARAGLVTSGRIDAIMMQLESLDEQVAELCEQCEVWGTALRAIHERREAQRRDAIPYTTDERDRIHATTAYAHKTHMALIATQDEIVAAQNSLSAVLTRLDKMIDAASGANLYDIAVQHTDPEN